MCPRKPKEAQMITKEHRHYFEDWKKAMACGLIGGRPFSQSTIDVYCLYTKSFLKEYKEVSLSNLKKVLIDTPVEQFAKRYKIFQAIQNFAGYLVEEGALDPGYLEQAKHYIPKRHLPPKKITVQEKGIEALISACTNKQDKLIVSLLAFTGLRVTEAANLKLSDINQDNAYLTVRLAKWGKTRRVGLTKRLQEVIQEYLASRSEAYKDKEWLFLNRFGEKITRYGIRTRLEKLGERVGVTVTPHALRRAFVTINANKGRPLPMLQIACGHNNITTTRSYCLTTEDETIEAMQAW
jgi:integrase